MAVSAPLRLRPLTEEAARDVERLARGATAAARLRDRARGCWLSHTGRRVAQIVLEGGLSDGTVRQWLKRVNRRGLAGVQDKQRAGRPATYTPEEVGIRVAASLSGPRTLGLPCARWTLDRLAASLAAARGIAMKRSRIGAVLVASCLRWRKQEAGFGERPDPAFAAKRGAS